METSDDSSRKQELRKAIRLALRDLSPATRVESSRLIVSQLADELKGFAEGGTVLIYAALPLEVNVWEIIQSASHLHYALPRVLPGSHLLECRKFSDPNTDLSTGAYQVLEPIPDRCPIVDPLDLVALVVPGLAFTKSGARLGKGGGYYDRLLAGLLTNTQTIGVGFDCQLCDDIPMDDHDQYLDSVITPSGVWGG